MKAPLFPLLILTALAGSTSGFAANSGNGGERSGRPERLFLTCNSAITEPCETTASVTGPSLQEAVISAHRSCPGQEPLQVWSRFATIPADLSLSPTSPLMISGSGIRLEVDFSNYPTPGTNSPFLGQGNLRLQDGKISQAVECRAYASQELIKLPPFHRERIVSARILPKATPFESLIEVTYWIKCGDSHSHLRVTRVTEGGGSQCNGNQCWGSTGKLTGLQLEVLAAAGPKCMGPDRRQTITRSLGNDVAFIELPSNGVQGLSLFPLQPAE